MARGARPDTPAAATSTLTSGVIAQGIEQGLVAQRVYTRHQPTANVQAVLREGESLTQFIENAVCREAEFRAEQNAAASRAEKALRRADKGVGMLTAEDFLADMAQRAKAAQQRIHAAVAARNKRAAG